MQENDLSVSPPAPFTANDRSVLVCASPGHVAKAVCDVKEGKVTLRLSEHRLAQFGTLSRQAEDNLTF